MLVRGALDDLRRGETARAAVTLESVLRVDPGNPEAHWYLGLLDRQRGRLDAAQRHLEAFLAQAGDAHEDWRASAERRLAGLRDERRLADEQGAAGPLRLVAAQSPHFRVHYDARLGEASPDYARTVVRYLEEAYHDVVTRLGVAPKEPTGVVLYGKAAYLAAHQHRFSFPTVGFFDGRIHVASAAHPAGELRSLLFHEFTHAVFAERSGGDRPFWLNEGLAELAERVSRGERGLSSSERALLRRRIAAGEWIPLERAGARLRRARRVGRAGRLSRGHRGGGVGRVAHRRRGDGRVARRDRCGPGLRRRVAACLRRRHGCARCGAAPRDPVRVRDALMRSAPALHEVEPTNARKEGSERRRRPGSLRGHRAGRGTHLASCSRQRRGCRERESRHLPDHARPSRAPRALSRRSRRGASPPTSPSSRAPTRAGSASASRPPTDTSTRSATRGSPFTIQSISKPFVYGLALEDRGKPAVLERIGVEPTGDAFNEISLESATGRPRNPMINAGAITATSLVAGDSRGRPLGPDPGALLALRRSQRSTSTRPSTARSATPATAIAPSATCCATSGSSSTIRSPTSTSTSGSARSR